MDEVDNIILYHLKSLGCELDDIKGLKQFTTSTFVEATARCLHAINPSIEVHYRLPPSMAAQFRVGANIAAAVQSVGYQSDIGYHTFMYLNEIEMRKIMLFLVDRLPKEQPEAKTTTFDAMTVLRKALAAKISRTTSWTPNFYKSQNTEVLRKFCSSRLLTPNDMNCLKSPKTKEESRFVSQYLPFTHLQPIHDHDVIASVLEKNAAGCSTRVDSETEFSNQDKKKIRLKQKLASILGSALSEHEQRAPDRLEDVAIWHRGESSNQPVRKSRFVQVQHQQFSQSKPSIPIELPMNNDSEGRQIEETLASLQSEMLELTSKTERFAAETRRTAGGIQQILEQMAEARNSITSKEKLRNVKKQTLNLLPDADENLTKLEGLVDASNRRLAALSKQWDKHRVPLVEQYNQMMHDINEQEHEQRQMDELIWQQEKLKELIKDLKDKEAIYKQLLGEYENMVKELNRSAYTQRILEIVNNIRKQNQDIDKVLQDTKAVQKEINFLSGKLDRIFTVTDEIIFKDAKKDDSVRKAYKYLASLHENWTALIKTVEETGVILKQIRDLDDQLEADDTNKVTENLQQITSDYRHMLAENNALLSKLR